MLARQDKLRVMKRESLVFETTNWMVLGEKLYSVAIIAADSDKQFLRPVLKLLKARTRRQRPWGTDSTSRPDPPGEQNGGLSAD